MIQLNMIAYSDSLLSFNPYAVYPVWQNWTAIVNDGIDQPIEDPTNMIPIMVGKALEEMEPTAKPPLVVKHFSENKQCSICRYHTKYHQHNCTCMYSR